MDRKRLGISIGVALAVGMLLGAALLSGAGAEALVVKVMNVGTHQAAVRVDVGSAAGDGYATWIYHLAPGGERSDRLDRPERGTLSIRVTGEWAAPADEGRGSARAAPDGRACDGVIDVLFEMDTTIGVSFPRIDETCGG